MALVVVSGEIVELVVDAIEVNAGVVVSCTSFTRIVGLENVTPEIVRTNSFPTSLDELAWTFSLPEDSYVTETLASTRLFISTFQRQLANAGDTLTCIRP